MKVDIKKYSKLVMALISAGLISGGVAYSAYQVKVENSRKNDVVKSMNQGKFLAQKIGQGVTMLGQDYLVKENLQESQFNSLIETKKEFDSWLEEIIDNPEYRDEAVALKDSWKDLSDQLDFLNTFYTGSIKGLSNPVESMMVTRKNRAYVISANNDNLPNDVHEGAEASISNQKIEYSSPLKQSLKVQVEKAITSYKTNSDVIMKTLDSIVAKSDKETASIKAEAMRSFMYIALSSFGLMLLSFFLLRSGAGKKVVDTSQEELNLILGNVKEGMFVMNPEWEIIGDISSSLGDMINKELSIGDNFLTFLQAKLDAKSINLSKDYLKLLLEKNLNEKLVSNVNPLRQVNVNSPSDPKMVAIALRPVKNGGVVTKVLVTISDATEQKHLEDIVKLEKTKSSNQFDFLLKIMQSDNKEKFIKFFQKLQEIVCDNNENITKATEDETSLREILAEMQRSTHTLKAEASALDLGMYQEMLHNFESKMIQVRKKEPLKTADLHELSIFHKELLEKTAGLISALEVAIKNRENGQSSEDAALLMGAEMSSTLGSVEAAPIVNKDEIPFHPNADSLDTGGLRLLEDDDGTPLGLGLGLEGLDALNSLSGGTIKHSESLLGDLSVLVKNGAEKIGKKVNLSLNLSTYDLVSEEKRDLIRSVLMHLVNNSVAHGIETVEVREKKNKYPVGVIQIFDEVTQDGLQDIVNIHVVDDGVGLDLAKIKEKAVSLGIDIGEGKPQDLIPLIFKPNFSTNEGEDMFSGRGVGLDFVKTELEKNGASINLKMRPGNYIEFSFKFNLNEY